MKRALFITLILCSSCQEAPAPQAERTQPTQSALGESCLTDLECTDGQFCNGAEACAAGSCVAGTPPCSACEESNDTCGSCDTDADADGEVSIACGGIDCDDNDPARYPGNPEICDADDRDEDCEPSTFGERDSDGDGYADALCCNRDGDVAICGTDCNDTDPLTHPTEVDSCDGIDNDCSGSIDDGHDIELLCVDADRDGYGAGTPVAVCGGSFGYSYLCNDCDDSNPAFHPGVQVCSGGDAVKYCGTDGQTRTASCQVPESQKGAFCFPQPNGTGVCMSTGRLR